MPFEPGTRLGPYEIIAPIGAGGMGEIYRARDTRLDRTVAVKVLTGVLAADVESRQRFEQEALAIAALNDPHICTVHDVGSHGDLDYLVLEYLEGETLADRLSRSPGPSVDEALAIAIQIGSALDRAHRAGIVHRDLKPGNVMLSRRGGPSSPVDVKLLDFGLAARTATAHPISQDPSLGETVGPSMVTTRPPTTAASGFSGTVQYMSPEQLDGGTGDHRVDIFAFGCVLYEMLAGRKAFEGASALKVIAAITHTEPPPIVALQSAHPLLDHVLRRCLEKDPERRWQNIGDVTGELRWILENPSAPPDTATLPAAPRRVGRWAVAAALLALTAVFVAGARAMRDRGAARELPSVRFEIATSPADDPSVALSPDGTMLAFIATQNRVPMLFVRSLAAIENRAFAGTEGASLPFWSPDARTIGFFAADKLKRIDVAGGSPLVVADAPTPRGGAWNKDGVILFAAGVGTAIRRVSSRGGTVEDVTDVKGGSGPAHRLPHFLPDGNRFLFTSTLGTPETNGLYVGSLDKMPPVRLLTGDTGGRFAAPDRLLTIRQGVLQAYVFNVNSNAVQGEPVVIAEGFGGASASGAFTASDTGVLAYRTSAAQRRQLTWVDRKGSVLGGIGEPGTDLTASPELSPDDRSVVVFRQPTGDNDIWIIELARGLARRVTDGPPADAHPLWDPDGLHVVFSSRRFGTGSPARQAVNGGPPEQLFAKNEDGLVLAWTRDRQHLLLRRNGAKTGADLVAVSAGGGSPEIVVAQSQHDETEGQFSPDGKAVAYVSNESGRAEVYVQSFPDARGRTQVSMDGGSQVRWSGDGKQIFYIASDGRMMAVAFTPGAAPSVKPPTTLFLTHLATGTNVLGLKPQYAVARDGRFLLNTALESAGAPIVVSINWRNGQAR
jgi:Tol biopolymer transport system component